MEADEPTAAKLDTCTFVVSAEHIGHAWVLSRSAKEVSTSNVSLHVWQRYS